METLFHSDYDLASPDGILTSLAKLSETSAEGIVSITNISPSFVGFSIDPHHVFFNIKSTLAQIGMEGIGQSYELDAKNHSAQVKVLFTAIGPIATEFLKILP